MAVSVPQKSWFGCAVDLMINVYNQQLDQKNFVDEITTMFHQIQKFAINKFTSRELNINSLAEGTWNDLSKVSKEHKISTLVQSGIFQLAVCDREMSDPYDHQYYKKNITCIQLAGYAQIKGNLDYILKNKEALEWICSANETQLTAQEQHEMVSTMRRISPHYYCGSQCKRMEIGLKITSKVLCEEVIRLLKVSDKQVVTSESGEAIMIFKSYLDKIIKPANETEQDFMRRNLIVLLQIRARQLP